MCFSTSTFEAPWRKLRRVHAEFKVLLLKTAVSEVDKKKNNFFLLDYTGMSIYTIYIFVGLIQ